MSAPQGEGSSQGAGYEWVLEHLLAYPGTYEIPLRTMYTLNATTQNQQQPPSLPSPTTVPGNAFPRRSQSSTDEQHSMTTMTAAAQLGASLMAHISQLPSQPTSLPPSFVTSFVRRCFPAELDQVDFPQALTALDYLKDLETRRRREVVAALDKLGIERDDLSHREKLARKYPGVLQWVAGIEEKERTVEALYSQVYIGLRRWTLINELSLTPFNKYNCLAMLNTLYPPDLKKGHFVQPTAQLTPQVLASQRRAFFQYICLVERKGPSVLSSLIGHSKNPGDETGWTRLRDTLDSYLRMANSVIEECYEITGRGQSTAAPSINTSECEEEGRRKVDSAISFGSAASSNRNSGQSQTTRPSTSSSFSQGSRQHSRQVSSADKELPEKPLPPPKDGEEDDVTLTQKAPGSALERIARELRKIKSRSNVKEDPRPRTSSAHIAEATTMENSERVPPTPGKERSLKSKLSLRRMRSNTALSEGGSARTSTRGVEQVSPGIPAYDAGEMIKSRQKWESMQKVKGKGSDQELHG